MIGPRGFVLLTVLAILPASLLRAQAPENAQRQARPKAEPLRIQKLSPQFEKILAEWASQTRGYEKLEGEVKRFTYDHVFQVEKRATGKFYYEAPDKGRIDLDGQKKRFQNPKKKGPNGKPFTVEPERDEQWVCDGRRIMQIDREQKQVDVYPIPADAQGRNIMNGPLPFLFGMPPNVAKKRYKLELVSNSPKQCRVQAIPRWQSDRANYKQAEIILDKQTWLPVAVRLFGPAGNKETVYTFWNLKPNKKKLFGIFGRDPFKPNLRGFKVINKVARQAKEELAPGEVRVPSLVGLDWKAADKVLEGKGLKPKWLRGPVAPRGQLVNVVSRQKPTRGEVVKEGAEVELTVFLKQSANAGNSNRK